jgi:hypothetical protein
VTKFHQLFLPDAMTVLEALPARLRAIRKLSPARRNHVILSRAENR